MRFYQTLLAGAALIASVVAQKPTIDSYPNSVSAGSTVEITYSPATATATLILRKGLSTDLDTIETITESATGGKFSWSVPRSLVNANDYAFEIKVGEQNNFSGQFTVTGGSTSSAASSASSSASRSGSTSASASLSTSASLSVSSSASSNSTITRATLSTSGTATGTASTRPTGSAASGTTGSAPPQNTGGAASLSSPFALFFGAAAAFAFLQ